MVQSTKSQNTDCEQYSKVNEYVNQVGHESIAITDQQHNDDVD